MKALFQKHRNETILAMIFLVLFVFFSFASRNFFTLSNVMNLFSQMVTLAFLTLGMAASMISGGMDLSIGAVCSMCTVLCATFVGTLGMHTLPALLITLAIAITCGLFNGFLIGYCKINSMLVTLGTQSLYTGIGLVISQGVTVSIPLDRFALFGRTRLFGFLPVEILILALGILLAVLVFSFLIPGRRIYLIGANPQVARFAGINIASNILVTYAFCSAYAFFGAIVLASRVASGRADVAAALVLKSVSAAVFGGVSTLGGIGTMAGAILGVAVIQIVTNGMDMMNFSTYLQQISIGAMLLIVLAFRHRKRH